MAALSWTDEKGKPSERAAALFKTPARTRHLCGVQQRSLQARAGFIVNCNIAALVADDDLV